MSPRRRIVPEVTLVIMRARLAAGDTVATIARAHCYDDETVRRALGRRSTICRVPPLPRIACPAECRPLLQAEAAKRGMAPAVFAAILLREALKGNLVPAILDEA